MVLPSYLFMYVYHKLMGLLHTKFYMDFDEEEWNQISTNPLIFQTIKDLMN